MVFVVFSKKIVFYVVVFHEETSLRERVGGSDVVICKNVYYKNSSGVSLGD